jgi:hypothetical protein
MAFRELVAQAVRLLVKPAVMVEQVQQRQIQQQRQQMAAVAVVHIPQVEVEMVVRVLFGPQQQVVLLGLAVVVVLELQGVIALEMLVYMAQVLVEVLQQPQQTALGRKVLLFLPITQDQLLPMQQQEH